MRIASLTASAVLTAAVLAVTAGPGRAAEPAQTTTPACSAATTEVSVQNVSRPVNHQLLTLTNTGRTPCHAYGHPYLGFDEDQAVTRVVDESRPQAVVTLAPGESAYAGIGLSAADGSGTHGRWARTLRVFLDNGSGSADEPTVVTLPRGTWIDDTAAVTHWQADPSDALMW
ncbi:DUF4232 domain-containing protein [Streptomyces sp. SCA3-4]|uniref:DUF4232 domain-containing protein n=1 Tax=Streptomyces sichuanensis TaxID=2871810 RepID=UPI001CE3383C|nr:DUF4232 domain-containing protein [Streptomyces sichuanensis]MCA6095154.1 DUF4232 domain-containing protein [Streptomyces sichuanensis]